MAIPARLPNVMQRRDFLSYASFASLYTCVQNSLKPSERRSCSSSAPFPREEIKPAVSSDSRSPKGKGTVSKKFRTSALSASWSVEEFSKGSSLRSSDLTAWRNLIAVHIREAAFLILSEISAFKKSSRLSRSPRKNIESPAEIAIAYLNIVEINYPFDFSYTSVLKKCNFSEAPVRGES